MRNIHQLHPTYLAALALVAALGTLVSAAVQGATASVSARWYVLSAGQLLCGLAAGTGPRQCAWTVATAAVVTYDLTLVSSARQTFATHLPNGVR